VFHHLPSSLCSLLRYLESFEVSHSLSSLGAILEDVLRFSLVVMGTSSLSLSCLGKVRMF